ncbi:MAG: hypothetical protein HC924_03055 [Synechococcaceae cyanobacterium SM2_3_2]|nr:hypothetical protein [Synechococcaceae cyanobacterium SM2_3_2]
MLKQLRRLSQRLRLFLPWIGILLALTGILLLKSCGSSQPTISSTEPSPAVVGEDARRGWLPIRPGSPLQSLTQILNAAEIDGIPLTVGQSITLQGTSPAIEWRDSTGRVLGRGSKVVYQAQRVGMETITAQIGQIAQSRVSFTVSTPDVVVAPHVKVLPDVSNALELDLANGILQLADDRGLPTLFAGDVVVGTVETIPALQIDTVGVVDGLLTLSVRPAQPNQVIRQGTVSFADLEIAIEQSGDFVTLLDIPGIPQPFDPRPQWSQFQITGDPISVGLTAKASGFWSYQAGASGYLSFDASSADGLADAEITLSGSLSGGLNLQAEEFSRWREAPAHQVVVSPNQGGVGRIWAGPVPLPLELNTQTEILWDPNLWLNGRLGLSLAYEGGTFQEQIKHNGTRAGSLASGQWRAEVETGSSMSGLLKMALYPRVQVRVLGSETTGGFVLGGVAAGRHQQVSVEQLPGSPGQLLGQVRGEVRVTLSGQIVHVQEGAEPNGGAPSVGRFIERPRLFPFVTFLFDVLEGIFNALDPGPSLTNPSPTLPSPSPTPSLTPEEIEQIICEITGDCEPQTDPGGNGGQCTPPPSPPPGECEAPEPGSQPLEGDAARSLIQQLIESGTEIVLDIFGGSVSQLPGAVNVDIIAQEGIRASVAELPNIVPPGSVSEIIASGPQAPFIEEVAGLLKPGGTIFINANLSNRFGRLPDSATLERLGLRVIQQSGTLDPRFESQIFCRQDPREDGTKDIDISTVRTTILERIL